jgi:hypothetical protein
VEDRAPRRLIAMLVGYPLVATAIAVDAAWAFRHGDWWPPAAYSLAVTAIACAIAACSETILEVPPAVQVVAVAANLVMANTAMITAAGEVSEHTPHPGGDTAVALVLNFATLTATLLICHLGETLAELLRPRDLPASNLSHPSPSSYSAATPPPPNVVQPTLIDPGGFLRTTGHFQRTDQQPQLDHDWEAMIHQLTDLQDHVGRTG